MRTRVIAELAAFLDQELPAFANPAELREIHDLLRGYVLGAGKCLRSLFCYWGWRAADGPDCSEIVRAGAALELFQAFALAHDDIMDDSDLRRGRPALHRALAELHRRRQWRGPTREFGVNLAILIGDLCLSYSDEMLRACGLPPDRLDPAQRLVHRMRTEVMIGQNLDLLGQAGGGSYEDALRIIRLKAAKYTVERPLQIGVLLAGGTEQLAAACSDYAIPLGEAFQLRDDVLGVFGDPAVTGKSADDDLRAGKPTVLMALARERADATQRSHIERWHGASDLDVGGAADLREVIRETGALRRVEEMVDSRVRQARTAATTLPVSDTVRDALLNLIAVTTVRTS